MTDGSNCEMPPVPACIRDPLARLSNNRVQSGYEPAWAVAQILALLEFVEQIHDFARQLKQHFLDARIADALD